MWFRILSDTQKKAWKNNHKKMSEARTEKAIRHPESVRKSYSSTHKAYDRTNYGDLNRRDQ